MQQPPRQPPKPPLHALSESLLGPPPRPFLVKRLTDAVNQIAGAALVAAFAVAAIATVAMLLIKLGMWVFG